MAFVVALSVAMLPVAAAPAASAKPAPMADMAAAMDDCCPDNTAPCDPGSDQCRWMSCCALQSFGIANAAVSEFSYPVITAAPLPALADRALPSHTGSAPFRPPRV